MKLDWVTTNVNYRIYTSHSRPIHPRFTLRNLIHRLAAPLRRADVAYREL